MPDLLVRDAEHLVTMTGDEIVGGSVAVTEGLVAVVGEAGSEPAGREVISHARDHPHDGTACPVALSSRERMSCPCLSRARVVSLELARSRRCDR